MSYAVLLHKKVPDISPFYLNPSLRTDQELIFDLIKQKCPKVENHLVYIVMIPYKMKDYYKTYFAYGKYYSVPEQMILQIVDYKLDQIYNILKLDISGDEKCKKINEIKQEDDVKITKYDYSNITDIN